MQFYDGSGEWVDQLEVRQSTIADAGRGLYAARDFFPGEMLTRYCGKRKKYPKKGKLPQYSLDLDGSEKFVVDAAGSEHFLFAHFINHAKKDSNVVMRSGGLFVVEKTVRKGEEFFANYGTGFTFEGASSATI